MYHHVQEMTSFRRVSEGDYRRTSTGERRRLSSTLSIDSIGDERGSMMERLENMGGLNRVVKNNVAQNLQQDSKRNLESSSTATSFDDAMEDTDDMLADPVGDLLLLLQEIRNQLNTDQDLINPFFDPSKQVKIFRFHKMLHLNHGINNSLFTATKLAKRISEGQSIKEDHKERIRNLELANQELRFSVSEADEKIAAAYAEFAQTKANWSKQKHMLIKGAEWQVEEEARQWKEKIEIREEEVEDIVINMKREIDVAVEIGRKEAFEEIAERNWEQEIEGLNKQIKQQKDAVANMAKDRDVAQLIITQLKAKVDASLEDEVAHQQDFMMRATETAKYKSEIQRLKKCMEEAEETITELKAENERLGAKGPDPSPSELDPKLLEEELAHLEEKLKADFLEEKLDLLEQLEECEGQLKEAQRTIDEAPMHTVPEGKVEELEELEERATYWKEQFERLKIDNLRLSEKILESETNYYNLQNILKMKEVHFETRLAVSEKLLMERYVVSLAPIRVAPLMAKYYYRLEKYGYRMKAPVIDEGAVARAREETKLLVQGAMRKDFDIVLNGDRLKYEEQLNELRAKQKLEKEMLVHEKMALQNHMNGQVTKLMAQLARAVPKQQDVSGSKDIFEKETHRQAKDLHANLLKFGALFRRRYNLRKLNMENFLVNKKEGLPYSLQVSRVVNEGLVCFSRFLHTQMALANLKRKLMSITISDKLRLDRMTKKLKETKVSPEVKAFLSRQKQHLETKREKLGTLRKTLSKTAKEMGRAFDMNSKDITISEENKVIADVECTLALYKANEMMTGVQLARHIINTDRTPAVVITSHGARREKKAVVVKTPVALPPRRPPTDDAWSLRNGISSIASFHLPQVTHSLWKPKKEIPTPRPAPLPPASLLITTSFADNLNPLINCPVAKIPCRNLQTASLCS